MKFVTEKSSLGNTPTAVILQRAFYTNVKCISCGGSGSGRFINQCPECGTMHDSYLCVGEIQMHTRVKTVFENGDVVYSLLGFEGGWNRAQKGRLFLKPIVYRLKKKATGKVLVMNGKRSVRDIVDLNATLPEFSKFFPEELSDFNVSSYYMANNHRLKDLLGFFDKKKDNYYFTVSESVVINSQIQTFYEKVSPADRARIYRNYDKYGTKGANIALLYGLGNKALNKLAWNNLHVSKSIATILKVGVKADALVAALAKFDEARALHVISFLGSAILLGYSLKKAINLVHRSGISIFNLINFAEDAVRMLNDILLQIPDYVLDLETPFRDLHDRLSRDSSALRALEYDNVEFPTMNFKGVETDCYKLVPAQKGGDLVRCGSYMNICVASYVNSVASGECDIYIVYNYQDKPVVCIETYKNKMRQAKIKNNDPVFDDYYLFNFVREWADDNGILWEDCYDMKYSSTKVIPGGVYNNLQLEEEELPF